jgi:hypothetical protein
MPRFSSAAVVWCFLLACVSCSNEAVVISKGDYELVQRGADLVQHQPGNLQLWHHPSSGKRKLVWSYVVGSPAVHDGLAVCSAGLTDDRRWKIYPAVLAFTPGGPPVDITELVTQKYCERQNIPYPPLRGALRYNVQSSTNGLVSLLGQRLPEATTEFMRGIEVELTPDEIEGWIKEARRTGTESVYGGVEFVEPKSQVNSTTQP